MRPVKSRVVGATLGYLANMKKLELEAFLVLSVQNLSLASPWYPLAVA
jgi:hypothetical protein